MICNCSFSKEFLKGLFITKEGRVISMKRDCRVLKTQIDKKGYCRLTTTHNRKHETFKVHRLVAKTFIPNPKNLATVNHKDGNKNNNHVDNLEWMSNTDNMRHAYRTGIREELKGEESNTSILTEKQARSIIYLLKTTDARHHTIAKLYNVSRSCITDINTGKSWKHINRKEVN